MLPDLNNANPVTLARPAGMPSRDPELDAWPGFASPPPGYGEVSFYWWQKDPLVRERIAWQLDQLDGKSISGLQVNYAHSDQGGLLWGLTYPTEPPLFSEGWWEIFNWFLKEAKSRGMSVSLSDYTLGSPGQGWYIDEILRDCPQLCGATLAHLEQAADPGKTFMLDLAPGMLSCVACHLENGRFIEKIDLGRFISDQQLRWNCPPGDWRVIEVFYQTVAMSIDPMHTLSGQKVIETFFQRFEDRNPGECGTGLNFFFSDELNFGVSGNLWNSRFAAEFLHRKGYDLLPEIAALFTDLGPRTCKIRLDYRDVMVQLEEECYFRPVYEWHQSRGMIYGCDHGGRGKDVIEFGDYFRTQRWNQGPGNDQPNLESDIVKNKVSSSIAHLYERPRTWLEGFYGSGWGTSSGQLADAIFRNFAMGHNLLSLHGLYYTTHGGHWEWAPPCNHFRMPYWKHMGELLKCSERLSYLLSQGFHRCDVALFYPVAAVEAGLDGDRSVSTAFSLAEYLVRQSVDFDFIDFESLARATVESGQLKVAGEAYRILILPAMRAVRISTIWKALEFHRAGGTVIAMGCLPEASDRTGSDDLLLDVAVAEIFGGKEMASCAEGLEKTTSPCGRGFLLSSNEQALAVINQVTPRDFQCLEKSEPDRPVYVQHRLIGRRELYLVYGAPSKARCFFRAQGLAEIWDPWSGTRRVIEDCIQTDEGTIMPMPLAMNEVHLIVFDPLARATSPDDETSKANAAEAEIIALPVDWEFELLPTMDNRWGDFQLPATEGLIGARIQKLWYMEDVSDAKNVLSPDVQTTGWRPITCTFGPCFKKIGPFPADTDHDILGRLMAGQMNRAGESLQFESRVYDWQSMSYSTRWGIEGDPGHQGYHGLKGEISDDFIGLGQLEFTATDSAYVPETAGSGYYLWTTVQAKQPERARISMGKLRPGKAWLNGHLLDLVEPDVELVAGVNTLLLFYPTAGKTYFVLESPSSVKPWQQDYPLAMTWFRKPGVYVFDIHGLGERPAGWYRFTSPPGLQGMTMRAYGQVQAWIGNQPIDLERIGQASDNASLYTVQIAKPAPQPVQVTLRIEPIPGCYAGAALAEPIELDCRPGRINLGDWSQIDGLLSYSGGAWYRQSVELGQEQLAGSVILDLGEVISSAEVHVNGHLAGVRAAPAWQFDLTPWIVAGHNRIEILVFNTLANHYATISTRYKGSTKSGLIGPVKLIIKPGKRSPKELQYAE